MKNHKIQVLVLFFSLALLAAPAGRAWNIWQHQVIAEIAERHLHPETRREISYLLGVRYRLADEAGWADYIRGSWWWTAPWHYINWPLELEEPEYDVFSTRQGNIVSAIEEQLKIYRDRKKSRRDRLEALQFIIHFVGDIHQPLHCGQDEDRGGNDVPVRFRRQLTNLHACWDGKIYDGGRETPAVHAAVLLEGLQPEERDRIMGGRPYDWAVESHRIDREFIYPRLEDLADRKSELLPPELSGPYTEAAQPIFRRRLLEGGLRLAYLLNEASRDEPAPPPEKAAILKSVPTPAAAIGVPAGPPDEDTR